MAFSMVGYATRSLTNCRTMSVLPFKRNVVDDVMILADRLTVSKPTRLLQRLRLPLFAGKVSAGFPSPAADHIEKNLDLNELLIQKPAATYFVRAQGESMLKAGIHSNDILIVDRSLEPVAGKIVICALNGEMTVKRLTFENEQWTLKAENPDYPDILLSDDLELVVWGVVTNVIHPV